jgi:hypothetical protein
VALIAGQLNELGEFVNPDCMARFMEDALPSKPDFGRRERRELLIAISTGIIEYLKAHDTDSFVVTVTGHNRAHTGRLVIS